MKAYQYTRVFCKILVPTDDRVNKTYTKVFIYPLYLPRHNIILEARLHVAVSIVNDVPEITPT